VPVREPARSVAERAVGLFNRDAGQGNRPRPDARAQWAAEPLIVPLRAALEGTEYRGSTALDDFTDDALESWSRLQLEADEFREIDSERILMIGALVGWARETGLEMRAPVAILLVVREGLIAELHTYASEQEAMAAAGQ
jgi:hypothetical protein